MDESTNERLRDIPISRWMDGRTDGWMNGWMDGLAGAINSQWWRRLPMVEKDTPQTMHAGTAASGAHRGASTIEDLDWSNEGRSQKKKKERGGGQKE